MNVRIGIADTGREIELEVDGRKEIVDRLEKAFSDGVHILWFTDIKGHEVGIPISRVAFVELIDEGGTSVGFSR